ncbi:hypothetical protein BGW36DRAFT_430295 [Talaromyces proteolyticus]|uniref:CPAF-like PDZ domain-containing protein n=1 Tax=Talaromyces proteolyticus TaxID=1131652 RepID=A0AAD4KMC6_9EURO|nr:uncharacterized protein BGW36DRAFT_430295 [Talaromyces proteolyticus]KAH8694281.1 hypothetical protein BGW36DRAFT_430295 [Talaromyces proteolyticus]
MHSNFQAIASGLVVILATGVLGASEDPCTEISNSYARESSSQKRVHVPAQLAVDCLTSMPFDSEKGVSFIDEYSKYLEFQSDLELLANPPPSSLSNRVDLRAGLQSIRSYASRGLYSNQFHFDSDLMDLINSANDGHLLITPCSSTAFTFMASDLVLVSISVDGVSSPQVYTQHDAKLLAAGLNDISPVTYINGVGAAALIEYQSRFQRLQDPDARYNMMLSNLPYNGQGVSNSEPFAAETVWRETSSYYLTFANQSSQSYDVLAVVTAPGGFSYKSGSDLFEGLCGTTTSPTTSPSGTPSTSASASAPAVPSSTSTPPPTTYPTPVMREEHNLVVGYYPDEPGLEDVAVLSVPTFETADATGLDALAPFAEIAQYFVGNATLDGKKRIIVDVQNNGGGVVDSGFALFSVFFPNETLYSATRFRAHDALDFMGTIFNGINPDNVSETIQEGLSSSGLVVQLMDNPNQESTFGNWNDFFGPYDADGIPSTSLVAEFNFGVEANPSTNPINTDGLGGDLNSMTPPFAPEDIIVLTDGRCSSTCTIFTDHMISKGVKTVAMGGRPSSNPMQAIGGIKGSQVEVLSNIDTGSQLAVSLLNGSITAGTPLLTTENMTRFEKVMPIPLENFPLPLAAGDRNSINYRNTYTKTDETTPTQFVYELATCHLFYTAQTLVNPAVTWAQAANATWGSGSCVGGIQAGNSIGSQSFDDNVSSNSENDSVSSPGTHTALGLLLALGSGMD